MLSEDVGTPAPHERISTPSRKTMALGHEPDRSDLLSRSFRFLGETELKGIADETLFFELALRGYDLSKLRDEESAAQIVKIIG